MVFLHTLLAIVLVIAKVPTQAANAAEVLRVAFEQDASEFDAQAVSDTFSLVIGSALFDSLLAYD